MTSSDSGEDFESADEDFDDYELKQTSATKSETLSGYSKETVVTNVNIEEDSNLLQLDKDVENPIVNESSNYLKWNVPKKLGNELCPNNKCISSTITNSNCDVTCNENSEIKLRKSKLPRDNQLRESKAAEDNHSLVENQTIHRDNTDVEKLNFGDGWDIEEENDFEITDIVRLSGGNSKAESRDTQLKGSKAPEDNHSLVEKQTIHHDNTDVKKLNFGDGWDIEEETDFEVTDTLRLSEGNSKAESGDTPQLKEPKSLRNTKLRESKAFEDNHSLVESQTIHLDKNDVKKLNLGDGWDVEEENDFEITDIVRPPDKNTESFHCSGDEKLLLEKKSESQDWGGWGGWGVSSLLSTASGTVSTFSSQVSAGLSTVIETTVGAPNPEELAAAPINIDQNINKIEEESACKESSISGGGPTSYVGFGSLVSGVSLLGSTVINRGLDTLESLGKKTMEVLQEGDPGLLKKRAMLFPNQDKPVLSQILREAKEKADHSDKEKDEKETARKVHFESIFDDFQGMVHLEALEMLSTQCSLKLQSQLMTLTGVELEDLQETLEQVRDLCQLPDEEEETEVLSQDQFTEQITQCVKGLNVNVSPAKIIQVNNGLTVMLDELKTSGGSATIVNQSAISALAEFTAAAMECFHKSAELLLANKLHKTSDESENLIQLTIHLCARVSAIANEFTQLLTKNHPIANSSLITNIFLEASNSSSYIKNACQLLVPILQVGAVSR